MPVNAVILDANLLVLLVVGLYSRSYIARHKRLAAYSEKDFDLLSAYVASASRLTAMALSKASSAPSFCRARRFFVLGLEILTVT